MPKHTWADGSEAELDDFVLGIESTGFPLEYRVTELLQEHHWRVISNRYYLDDVQASPREIDLVAYKAREIEDFVLYTTLFISCKKSLERVWALLSRKMDADDPNRDCHPTHVWTNCAEHVFMTRDAHWRSAYAELAAASAAARLLAVPTRHAFAFQEMQKDGGIPKNDRAIFDSSVTLLKALGYELETLPSRQEKRSLYQFSLMSVVDTSGLLDLRFSPEGVAPTPVDDQIYFADYMLNRRRFAARVHLVLFAALARVLDEYDALHKVNCEYFHTQYQDFYEKVRVDWEAKRLVMESFRQEVAGAIRARLPEDLRNAFDARAIDVQFDKLHGVSVEAGFDGSTAMTLNADEHLCRKVASALKRCLHYGGAFHFSEDTVPF